MSEYVLAYEHSVQANMTLEAFCRGLEDFARRPQAYIETLKGVVLIEEKSDGARCVIRRKIEFETFSFEDTITLTPGGEMIEKIAPFGQTAGSLYLVRGERLSHDSIRVTFTYRESDAEHLPEKLARLRHLAWAQKDRKLLDQIKDTFCRAAER